MIYLEINILSLHQDYSIHDTAFNQDQLVL